MIVVGLGNAEWSVAVRVLAVNVRLNTQQKYNHIKLVLLDSKMQWGVSQII